MGKFNGIKCDVCPKIEELTDSLQPPSGWVTIEIHRVGNSGESQKLTLCSTKCGAKWFRERERANADISKMTQEEFCEKNCSVGEDQEYSIHSEHCPKGKPYLR